MSRSHIVVPRVTVITTIWLGALTLLLLCTANFSDHQANDAIAALLPAWKIAWFATPQLPEFVGQNFWVTSGPWGALSNRMPGVILWGVPFYRLLGNSLSPTFLPAAVAAAVSVSLGSVALYGALQRLVSPTIARASVTLLVVGTGIWTTAADALWPHGPDVLWLGLAMYGLSRDRWRLAGAACALAILTRPHLAVAAAVIGAYIAVQRHTWKPVWQLGWTSALGVAGLVGWNRVVWGQWAVLPDFYMARMTTATETAAAGSQSLSAALVILGDKVGGTLLSPGRGLFTYSPFLLLLIPGIRVAWMSSPSWVRACALGGAAYMTVQLVGNSFAGGDGFTSYRLSIEMVVLCCPLLALCWVHWTSVKSWRRACFAILAWLAFVQHAIGAFVGHEDGVLRDPWSSWAISARFPLATGTQWALLALSAVAASILLWRVARGPGSWSLPSQGA